MAIDKYIDFQKSRIFYQVSGTGRSVVLLHGLPADHNLWNAQVRELTQFKFIVPDLPGSGSSSLIDDMSMEGMAEVIKAILEAEEIKTAAIVGHSMGGYVALAFAEKYPGFLNGLGLFHSTAYPDSDERKTIRKKGIDTVRKSGPFEFLKTMIPNLFSPIYKAAPQITPGGNAIDELIAGANNFSSEAIVSYYESMMARPDRTKVLKNSKLPMLFVAGNHDSVIPLSDILKLCHLPEISYFHVLAEAAHMGMIEDPGKTNSILNDYLINLS